MEIKGKCIQVMDVVTGTKKDGSGEWKKMDFVIETEGQYPKKVCLQLFGDKVNNTPAVGDNLTCSISLESREYNSRWYTQANCWKIEGFTGNMKKAKSGAPASDDLDWGKSQPPPPEKKAPVSNDSDDLPF